MESSFMKYRSALLEWRENGYIVTYIMRRAERDKDLTLDEFLMLCAIAFDKE